MKHPLPELLVPAGNLAKMKVACLYGADAVYLSGQHFGLRAAADNFTPVEMQEGVTFAHQHKVKVFVTLNGFLHDSDLAQLPDYLHFLQELDVDALIVSDLGVVSLLRQHCRIPIHLSTQASCLNHYSALWWKEQGVQRLVLGREVSIREAALIKQRTGLEVELFIHGSMCMAYSGNCTISNYTSGRDSNRGGCAHSCRFEYSLREINPTIASEVEAPRHSFFMSSKDLMGLELLPEFINHGIDSLKIEGRMKGPLYAANTARIYKHALLRADSATDWSQELHELNKMAHREYTQASLQTPADASSIHREREGDEAEAIAAGEVLQVYPERAIVLNVRSKFSAGDQLEILAFDGSNIALDLSWIRDVRGELLSATRPGSVVLIPWHEGVMPDMLVRKLMLPAEISLSESQAVL